MTAQQPLTRELLLLADLSGYTGYLTGSEPEEAPMIAGDLVGTVVESLVPPFELVGLEGDAAFLHVDPSRLDGAGLIATIAASYDAFRRRVESLRLGSSCQCSACRTVPQLDLKFFAHVGTVLPQRIAGRDELSGRDVILVHRLMKDSAPAQAGAKSYALLTDAVVEELQIDPIAAGLQPARQEYEHLGVVEGYVLDGDALRAAARSDAAQDTEGTTVAEAQRTIPASADVVWELLTTPTGRQAWEGIELVEELAPDGRQGIGSMSRCVARRLTTLEEIVDWSPPRRLARRTELPDIGPAIVAYALEAADGGTSLSARWRAIGALPQTPDSEPLAAALGRLEAVAVTR
jgi:uncharacterized protein YndB with AHSA1/START domain